MTKDLKEYVAAHIGQIHRTPSSQELCQMRITTVVAIIPAIASASVAVALAPAHADPNSDFLECLNQRGVVITDVSKAVALGRRIQNDEVAGVPANQIIWNLENDWGESEDMAYADMNCAAQTLENG